MKYGRQIGSNQKAKRKRGKGSSRGVGCNEHLLILCRRGQSRSLSKSQTMPICATHTQPLTKLCIKNWILCKPLYAFESKITFTDSMTIRISSVNHYSDYISITYYYLFSSFAQFSLVITFQHFVI